MSPTADAQSAAGAATSSAPQSAAPATLSMSDIARLAQVRRPVVTMWRRRKASGADPFPDPLDPTARELFFGAAEVAAWLVRTGLGNNPAAAADAAAYARPAPSTAQSPGADDHLHALLTLAAITGESLTETEQEDLLDLADDVDPGDHFCYREIAASSEDPTLATHAGALADAAYSPASALEQILRDHRRRHSSSSQALSTPALTLIADLAIALQTSEDDEPHFIDPAPGAGDLLMAVRTQLPEHLTAVVHTPATDTPEDRRTIRRLVAGELVRHSLDVELGDLPSAVVLTHLPGSATTASTLAVLRRVDDIALELAPDQRAVIIAPARALIDPLPDPEADNLRAGLLRLDRVRSILRLPPGVVPSQHRQSMALWVLGQTHPDVPADRRWTTVADLRDLTLSAAVSVDVVNDTLAAMGNEQTVRAHAFHYSRRVQASAVIAEPGALVSGPVMSQARLARSGPEAAVRISELAELLDGDAHPALAPHLDLVSTGQSPSSRGPTRQTIQHWLEAGDLELLSGSRISTEHLSEDAGVPILGAELLPAGALLANQGIELLTLAAHYPAAQLTKPGDVVFTVAGGLRAAVDDGGAVVTYPARTLRTRPGSDLDPHLLCHALNSRGHSGGQDWRTVLVPQISAEQRESLREAVTALDNAYRHAAQRLATLRDLKHEVLDGVSARTLTFHTTNPSEGP